MTYKVGDKVRAAGSWEGEIVVIQDNPDSITQPFGVSIDTSTPEEKAPFYLTMYFSENQLEPLEEV